LKSFRILWKVTFSSWSFWSKEPWKFIRGQFHQPCGAKHKFISTKKMPLSFNNRIAPTSKHEVRVNFFDVWSMPKRHCKSTCAKETINLIVKLTPFAFLSSKADSNVTKTSRGHKKMFNQKTRKEKYFKWKFTFSVKNDQIRKAAKIVEMSFN